MSYTSHNVSGFHGLFNSEDKAVASPKSGRGKKQNLRSTQKLVKIHNTCGQLMSKKLRFSLPPKNYVWNTLLICLNINSLDAIFVKILLKLSKLLRYYIIQGNLCRGGCIRDASSSGSLVQYNLYSWHSTLSSSLHYSIFLSFFSFSYS